MAANCYGASWRLQAAALERHWRQICISGLLIDVRRAKAGQSVLGRNRRVAIGIISPQCMRMKWHFTFEQSNRVRATLLSEVV